MEVGGWEAALPLSSLLLSSPHTCTACHCTCTAAIGSGWRDMKSAGGGIMVSAMRYIDIDE